MDKACDECKHLEIINDGISGIYAKCPYKTFYLWQDDTRTLTCNYWDGRNNH